MNKMPKKTKKTVQAKYPGQFVQLQGGTLDIQAAGEGKLPKFTMVAYTGGKMNVAGFDLPLVVDLSGMRIPSQRLPIRLNHDSGQGVGHSERIATENGEVTAAGVISRNTEWARDVAASGINGFPWQASIGAAVSSVEEFADGVEFEVNGRTFNGPAHVVRASILKELSFVDLGADPNTSAKLAAKKKEPTMPEANAKTEKTVEKTTETIAAITTPATVEATADPVKEMRAAAAAEATRIAGIRKVCADGPADIEAKAIAEGWDVNKAELEVLRASRPASPVSGAKPKSPESGVLIAAACRAAGMTDDRAVKAFGEQSVEASDKMRGIGLQEFCEIACGRELPRYQQDAVGWLQAAFSTLSLPGILSNVAHKMLLEGFNSVEEAWRNIARVGTVSDFKEHTRYRLTDDMKFQRVATGGELKHGKLGEQVFTQKADTFGIMFGLDRKQIINDDLGAFSAIPQTLGVGAAEAISEAVFELLLSNPGSFFATGNKNFASGTETALSIDGLTAAELLFLEQTKPNGRPLGVMPRVLLVPPALSVAATQLMNSLQLNETTTANKAKPASNPHAGKFTVATSAYLSNSTISGSSNKAWYLFADPNRIAALEVAFLNGQQTPTVERADADFSTLGIQFRGYIDFGVKEQDHRAAVKMKGEA